MSTGLPEQGAPGPGVVDVRSRIVATTTKATSAPEKRALTSKVDPIRPKSVVKVVSTSPRGARVNAGPAAASAVVGDQAGPEGGVEPVAHREEATTPRRAG